MNISTHTYSYIHYMRMPWICYRLSRYGNNVRLPRPPLQSLPRRHWNWWRHQKWCHLTAVSYFRCYYYFDFLFFDSSIRVAASVGPSTSCPAAEGAAFPCRSPERNISIKATYSIQECSYRHFNSFLRANWFGKLCFYINIRIHNSTI